jgi:hypothetical protein
MALRCRPRDSSSHRKAKASGLQGTVKPGKTVKRRVQITLLSAPCRQAASLLPSYPDTPLPANSTHLRWQLSTVSFSAPIAS